MRIIFYLISTISTFSALNSGSFFTIPSNEQVADQLVDQGKLDPVFWDFIKPYYAQPIDVPQGELNILLELFPQLPADLPILKDSLEKYEPWDETAKMQFFSDFPILVQFEPILRFEIKNVPSRAKTDFSISGQGMAKPFSYGVNLLLCFPEKIKIDTRIKFTNDYARWYRRVVTIAPSEKCTLQIGNFGSFFDKGLFFGYFSPKISNSLSYNNWLYGSAATWNGFKIRVGEIGNGFTNRLCGNTFFHKREKETSIGGILKLEVNEKIVLSSGVSSLYLSENATLSNGHYYVHSGVKLNFAILKSELQTGLNVESPRSIPLYLESKFGISGKECDLIVIVLPKGFNAPYSFLNRQINNSNETVTSTITSVHVQSRYQPLKWLSVLPAINTVFKKGTTEDCCLKLSCTGLFSNVICNVSYSWMPACTESDTTNNSLNNMLSVHLLKKIIIKSELDIISWNRFGHSITGSISTKLDLFPAVTFKPSVSFSQANGKEVSIAYGIQQILCLWDKTFTELFLEQSIKQKKQREFLRVEAKTSFLF